MLVEHFLIGGELLVGDQGKVGAFGQVMADATVLAFAGPAFPGAVGMAKKDLEAEVGGEGLVVGYLLTLVVSEAQTELGRDVDETTSEGLTHASGVFLLQTAEHGVTSGAFDQHANGRAVAGTQNQVTRVVTGDQARLHFGGTLVDQHHVRYLALGCGHAPAAGFSHSVDASQASDQRALELPNRGDINVAVNGFVGGVHRGKLVNDVLFPAAAGFFMRPTATCVNERHALINCTANASKCCVKCELVSAHGVRRAQF